LDIVTADGGDHLLKIIVSVFFYYKLQETAREMKGAGHRRVSGQVKVEMV